jgi:hypothetical protein
MISNNPGQHPPSGASRTPMTLSASPASKASGFEKDAGIIEGIGDIRDRELQSVCLAGDDCRFGLEHGGEAIVLYGHAQRILVDSIRSCPDD